MRSGRWPTWWPPAPPALPRAPAPLGVVGAGGMLANVVGVPLGAFAGQLIGLARTVLGARGSSRSAAVALIARHVPHDGRRPQTVSIRSELTALRSGRLWLALAACATTTGGVLSAYSYISPLLTDRAGIAAGLVPLVLGRLRCRRPGRVRSLGGRLGDAPPARDDHRGPRGDHGPAAGDLPALRLRRCPRSSLVALLGLFGLGANPVLISLAVRFAGQAPTLGSALSVSAFNVGTAVGSWIAGLALDSALGAVGPVLVGAAIAALTLVPTVALAVTQRHRAVASAPPPPLACAAA